MTHQPKHDIHNMVSKIIQTSKLNHQEHFDLVTIFLSDCLVTESEKMEINLVFDNIYKGKVKFID